MQRELNPIEQQEEGGGAMSFDRAISAVMKRAKLVVAFPIVLVSIVTAAVMLMPNRYDASAIIQIDPRSKSITNLDTTIAGLKVDSFAADNEIEIIQSRPIVLKVIDVLDLRNDPEFQRPSLFKRLLSVFGAGSPEKKRAERQPSPDRDEIADIIDVGNLGATLPVSDDIAEAFIKNLKVTRVRNTLLIDIRYSAQDASKAARIANTIAEVYLKDQLDSKTHGASTAAKLLEQKLEEMRLKVADAERRVEQWKADHNVFDSGGQVLSERELASLLEKTVAARSATSEARAKYDQAQRLVSAGDTGNTLAEVLQSTTVHALKDQLATITRRLAELRIKYGPKHPEILKANAERTETQAQLNAEIARLIANLRNEVAVAEGRERQLAQTMNDLKEQQIITKDKGVELTQLISEAETSKQLFEALLARYKQTSETQDFQLPDVRIIEKADAPLFPASPKRKQLVLMSAAAGTIFGIAFALLLELMAPGISRQEDIERVFDVAHLASVPSASVGNSLLSPGKAARLVVAEPLSAYADAIRNARRELDMRRSGYDPRIILVVSSVAGEGAEMIASNLAHNYAMTGGRPLLIDGDARLQPLTRQLAAGRQRGMLDQVMARRPLEEAVLHDGLTGLNFLPATGPTPLKQPIPETLNSTTCAKSIVGLKAHFDTIVISAPPLMPVIDGRILADYADQIVFVVAWQKTPKQLAKAALKTLGINDGKLAGVVLNDVAPEALDETRGWPLDMFGRSTAGKVAGTRHYAT